MTRLSEMIEAWSKEGVTLIEVTREDKDRATWILYKVTEPASTSDYGRHYALILAINKAEEVVAHNFHNTSSHGSRSFFEQCLDWWKEHLEEGLVTPEGNPICV